MALTLDVVFVVTDGKGKSSRLTIPLPGATAYADAVAFAQTYWPLLDAVINGGNVIAKIAQEVPSITSSNPTALSDIQEGAKFIWKSVENFTKSLRIPTFLETKLLQSGASEIVDTSDTDVAALITAMTSGLDTTGNGGSGVISPCDIRGEDLTSFVSAIEDWGK